jgi:hypothetical protein
MKSILIAIAALLTHTLAGEEAKLPDPFAEPKATQERWPSSITPTKQELEKLGEPTLGEPAQKVSIGVRFIWVPTFDSPISIRASKQNDKTTLTVVQMAGKGGYDWGSVKKTTINIDDKQWAKLVELCAVDGARKPSQKLPKDFRENFIEAMSGLDGSKWFLEVNDAKGYTVEGIPNPIIEDAEEAKSLKEKSNLDFKPFLNVCFYLFDLSGLKERPNY